VLQDIWEIRFFCEGAGLEEELKTASEIVKALCEIDWCIGYDIYCDMHNGESKNAELLDEAREKAIKLMIVNE
jgi:hypothetical protein